MAKLNFENDGGPSGLKELYTYICDTGLDYCFPSGKEQLDIVIKSISQILEVYKNIYDEANCIPILYGYSTIINSFVYDTSLTNEAIMFLTVNFSIGYNNISEEKIKKIIAFSVLNWNNNNFSIDTLNAAEIIKDKVNELFENA